MSEFNQRVARALVDHGKLIEIGWKIYRHLALKDTPNSEIDPYREAFFTGASHLFTAMTAMLEPGDGETQADLRRMNALSEEVATHEDFLRLKYGRSSGSA